MIKSIKFLKDLQLSSFSDYKLQPEAFTMNRPERKLMKDFFWCREIGLNKKLLHKSIELSVYIIRKKSLKNYFILS